MPRFPLAPVLAVLAVPAAAQDIQYQLVNESGLTLMEFYASPVEDPGWSNDLLGARVLPPDSTGTVTIADGADACEYDLLMVFEDGREVTDRVDICDLASYTLTAE
ncbi:hypothetical protein [Rubellimicrobium sp. CFH 75288]|uniref:hypothetical protein n=1 Tax=Rubellimicrobium sp. CFH 75288 TaxID=2697034 RepID=UPI00141324C7|nr:hypothetical protein [Rubellimicrobium sp. CFH 75288]NAZ36722.1 hypothetical protein [Rubellimicrobium sp. CFH 75288]